MFFPVKNSFATKAISTPVKEALSDLEQMIETGNVQVARRSDALVLVTLKDRHFVGAIGGRG
jgi:hypothetical protein